MSDSDQSSDSEVEEQKGPDFFLTQKEQESESLESSEHPEEYNQFNYEKIIGFDKKGLLELFQEIDFDNIIQDEEEILQYIRKNKADMIKKKEKEISSMSNTLLYYLTLSFRREKEHRNH